MTYPIAEAPEWLRLLVGLLILGSPFILAAFAAGVALGRRGWTEAIERSIVVWHGDEKDAVISYRGTEAMVARKVKEGHAQCCALEYAKALEVKEGR